MKKALNWQLHHPKHKLYDWTNGAFYTGVFAAYETLDSKNIYKAIYAMGESNKWEPGPRLHHADDHVICQTYIDLYRISNEKKMIQSFIETMDEFMATPYETGGFRKCTWSWCDALYMSPPAFARMGKVTGEQKHYDFLNEWWWKVSDFYYDEDEHLYFRDETFFEKAEPNGANVFWSRGNGWVLGGLVRVMQYLPVNDPMRPKYEQQFKEMCEKVVKIQGKDGLWGSGLLDREALPQAETSGSTFFVYGLAYGINEGILDKATYGSATIKAWKALKTFVKKDGMFTGIQPVGASPKKFDKNNSMPYGVGAFLLASSEVYRMLEK